MLPKDHFKTKTDSGNFSDNFSNIMEDSLYLWLAFPLAQSILLTSYGGHQDFLRSIYHHLWTRKYQETSFEITYITTSVLHCVIAVLPPPDKQVHHPYPETSFCRKEDPHLCSSYSFKYNRILAASSIGNVSLLITGALNP